jgi:transcriptional regulator with XRE-family HTH domain
MVKEEAITGWIPRKGLPENIEMRLTLYGWSRQTLCDRLGISMSTVSRWMTGASEAPVWLLDYLDVFRFVQIADVRPPAMTGEQLRAKLRALNWNQVYLAQRVDVSENTVSRWTTGEVDVPLWLSAFIEAMLEIRRLALGFGVAG